MIIIADTICNSFHMFGFGKKILKSSMVNILYSNSEYVKNHENILAERSFDLRTSGLWAQHASTAPLCCSCKQKNQVFHMRQTLNFWHLWEVPFQPDSKCNIATGFFWSDDEFRPKGKFWSLKSLTSSYFNQLQNLSNSNIGSQNSKFLIEILHRMKCTKNRFLKLVVKICWPTVSFQAYTFKLLPTLIFTIYISSKSSGRTCF